MNLAAEKLELVRIGGAQRYKRKREVFLGNRWRFKEFTFKDVMDGTVPRCDFVWLDLGRLGRAADGRENLKRVASLKGKSNPSPFFLISGSAYGKKRQYLLRAILDSFVDLSNLQIQLLGDPDVLSAITRFSALMTRRSPVSTADLAPRVKVPNADLRSEKGRLSARPISALFGVTMVSLGNWIGSSKAALSKTPDSSSIQASLQLFARIAAFREAVGGDIAFRQWLRTPHKMLQNKTPCQWLERGAICEIAEFVEDALAGQPS